MCLSDLQSALDDCRSLEAVMLRINRGSKSLRAKELTNKAVRFSNGPKWFSTDCNAPIRRRCICRLSTGHLVPRKQFQA